MVNFGYPYNDIVICKDSTDYLVHTTDNLHNLITANPVNNVTIEAHNVVTTMTILIILYAKYVHAVRLSLAFFDMKSDFFQIPKYLKPDMEIQ